MSDMIVTTPLKTKLVEDYDFLVGPGMMMPVTLDTSMGDVLLETDDRLVIKISPKPNPTDPSKLSPAEKITIYKLHLISIQQRTREITELTPDQAFEWQKTVQELGGRVQ